MIFRQFTAEVFCIFFLFLFEIVCKLGFSILIQELFIRVSDISTGNNKQLSYIFALCSGILLILSQIGKNNGMYESRFLASRAKSELIFLIYAKISKISQYTAKSQELGKIMNLLSNDFNSIESKIPMIFSSLVAPFALIGAITIITFRFGWPGLLIAAVIISIVPLQIVISRYNGKILKKINTNKDQRIKICTEIMEGIKFIKLYGW